MKEYGPEDIRLKSYSTIQCVASSQSGKSFLCTYIALKREKVFDKEHETIVYLYKHFQDIVKKRKRKIQIYIF